MAFSGNNGVKMLAAALMLAAAPVVAAAQAVTEDEVIAELQREGFMVVDTGTTLLGRLRITAMGPEGTREVVLNPRNGKVLRDVIIEKAAEKQMEIATTASVPTVVTATLAPAAAAVEPQRAVAEPVAHVAAAEPSAPAAAPAAEAALTAAQDRAAERPPE